MENNFDLFSWCLSNSLFFVYINQYWGQDLFSRFVLVLILILVLSYIYQLVYETFNFVPGLDLGTSGLDPNTNSNPKLSFSISQSKIRSTN